VRCQISAKMDNCTYSEFRVIIQHDLSIFTAMQTRSSDENFVCLAVCPSACLSSAWIVTKRKKNQCRFFILTKDDLTYFSDKKKGWLGRPLLREILGSTGPRWSEIADFEQIIARSASTVTPSEKNSINTNWKSTKRFPMSLRWSSYVAPKSPKGGSQKQNGRFPCNIALRLKKVCYKVSLCENCQRQSCRAFIGLTIHAKNDLWRTFPSTWNFWVKVTELERNRRFSIHFSPVSPQP